MLLNRTSSKNADWSIYKAIVGRYKPLINSQEDVLERGSERHTLIQPWRPELNLQCILRPAVITPQKMDGLEWRRVPNDTKNARIESQY